MTTGSTARLAFLTGLLTALAACEAYAPEAGPPTFVLPGTHAALTCEECHGPPPFVAFTWDTDCVSCHEVDRKDAAHYPGQGCSGDGTGCHADTDVTWADALNGIDHDFLPLDAVHAVPCTSCHSADPPTGLDIIPENGNATLCWSCHEEDRFVEPLYTPYAPPTLHYIEDPADVAPYAEVRWDCKACHDRESRVGGPVEGWTVPAGQDHGGIRFPHATQTTGVALPGASWVAACTDCHPDKPPVFTCTTACHQTIFIDPIAEHAGLTPIVNDAVCSVEGCHPHADLRPE